MKAGWRSWARAWVQPPGVTGATGGKAASCSKNSCQWRWTERVVFCRTRRLTTGKPSGECRVKSAGPTRGRAQKSDACRRRRVCSTRSTRQLGTGASSYRIPRLGTDCQSNVHTIPHQHLSPGLPFVSPTIALKNPAAIFWHLWRRGWPLVASVEGRNDPAVAIELLRRPPNPAPLLTAGGYSRKSGADVAGS